MQGLADNIIPDLAKFRADGFLAFEQLADRATVTELGALYDRFLSGAIDCSPTDRQLGRVTRQIMVPSRYHPSFVRNQALDNAREISRALLEVDDPEFVFDMLIYKPPGHPAATAWHQDMSYAYAPFARAGIRVPQSAIVQFWVALDDVDIENGCMHFIPGHHREPLLQHYVASGEPTDDARMLAIADPEKVLDLKRAVACPLRAGGATVHNYGTPHFTPPNRSATRPRRAYIFSFANPAWLKVKPSF
ncbi:MAG: phytanoyl-CoA dioxygenase family protein [Candidatus Binataceae bacterium]